MGKNIFLPALLSCVAAEKGTCCYLPEGILGFVRKCGMAGAGAVNRVCDFSFITIFFL